MNLEDAVKQARRSSHGSRFHQEAMSVIRREYRAAHPNLNEPTLDELWGWIDYTNQQTGVE